MYNCLKHGECSLKLKVRDMSICSCSDYKEVVKSLSVRIIYANCAL